MAKLPAVQEQLSIQGNVSVTILEYPSDILVVQYTEEFDYVMLGFSDGSIGAVKNNELAFKMEDELTSKTFVTGMKHRPISPNFPIINTFIVTYGNGLLKTWNYNFKKSPFTTDEKRLTTGITYHPRLAQFITFGDNKKIYLYDDDSKRQDRVLSASDEKTATNGHTKTVTCATFHPRNANELISGSIDNTVQFWDTRQPNATRNVTGVRIAGPGLEFTPKGTEFITCSPDPTQGNTLRLWDYATGKELQKLDPDKLKTAPVGDHLKIFTLNHDEEYLQIRCGTYLTKSHFVCAGGEPNFLRIVDMNTNKSIVLISNIHKPVKSISVGPATKGVFPEFVFAAGKRTYTVIPK